MWERRRRRRAAHRAFPREKGLEGCVRVQQGDGEMKVGDQAGEVLGRNGIRQARLKVNYGTYKVKK